MDFFEELLMAIFAFGAGFIFGKSSEKEKIEEKTEIYIESERLYEVLYELVL